MNERRLLRFGGAGAVLGVIVCFTPLVVTVLAGVGLASWFTPIDAVFHGVMAVGVGAMGYGEYRLWKKSRARAPLETTHT